MWIRDVVDLAWDNLSPAPLEATCCPVRAK